MIRKILAPLAGRPVDRHTLATAFQVAQRLGAHVDALCVTPRAEVHAPVETASIPAALSRELLKIATEERADTVAEARAAFEAARNGAGASWGEETGTLGDVIPEEARLSDLVVFAQDPDVVSIVGNAIEATLFNSGRPLLLAPAGDPAAVGSVCVIAWAGSSVASRAVRAALPFLEQADRTVILTTDRGDKGRGDKNRAADPERLIGYLGCHDVTASVEKVDTSHRAISTALTETALGLGGDLLIMGAYGHSRVREMVLGGVTHDMLRGAPALPVLMAH
jgi:nucleotide-binding universal stress UspA family protein